MKKALAMLLVFVLVLAGCKAANPIETVDVGGVFDPEASPAAADVSSSNPSIHSSLTHYNVSSYLDTMAAMHYTVLNPDGEPFSYDGENSEIYTAEGGDSELVIIQFIAWSNETQALSYVQSERDRMIKDTGNEGIAVRSSVEGTAQTLYLFASANETDTDKLARCLLRDGQTVFFIGGNELTMDVLQQIIGQLGFANLL